jgi:membrane protein DedA with SNARE-associated domain
MFNLDAHIADILASLSGYAYQPMKVYALVSILMLASSFGLPVPEEVTLVSAGLVAHMALDPATYPPPYPGAEGVGIFTLCVVSFFAVFLSDLVVYLLGKYFGAKIIKTKFFQKQVAGKGFNTINSWFQKYGGWCAGIFRFTPGLRFPGHLSCGLLGIPLWKFVLIDGTAALLSVPTQVYFVATYGDVILGKFKEFKIILFSILAVVFVVWLLRKVYLKHTAHKNQLQELEK